MSTISTAKMTARQFLQLGEDPPGVRLELVDGEIAVSPSPIPDHSYTEKSLSALLFEHIRKHKLGRLYGDVDTLFGEYDVRRPDLIYFANARLHLVGRKFMEGPPDLCFEILSPSSGVIDRKDKFKQYQEAGVAHYWIVDPRKQTLEGYKLEDGKYRLIAGGEKQEIIALPPFEDLNIPLGELWHPWER